MQAANQLRNSDIGSAKASWESAHAEDSSDAETLIYLEDQRVLSSGTPYATFVIGVPLPNSPVDAASRDQLQGAYVAQKEYNDNAALSGGLRVRLLIAKSGSNDTNSITIAKQIVKAAQHDKTIVGILGWTKTTSSLDVIPIFTKARIPILSSTALGDNLTGISKYFFHTTPLNENAAPVLAKYAQSQLQRKQRLIVLEDQQEPFSQNLAQDFTTQFNTNGYQVFDTEQFHSGGSPSELSAIMKNVLKKKPDVIFMAAYKANIYQNLLAPIYELPPSDPLKIISDSSIYPIVDNLQKRPGDVARFHFVSTAFPDEWEVIKPSAKTPPFFDQHLQGKDLPGEYSQAFQSAKPPSNPYGYTRADAPVMLTYDGLNVLLKGMQIAEQGQSTANITPGTMNITPDDLQQALTTISGPQAFQGITGQISFDSNHDPTDKELLVLRGTPQGLQIEDHDYQGCFLVQDFLSQNCDNIGGV
ncbi:MAG TPA: ABC transporter substrate-binding protein [Ktedonobacteraceae bacterium]